MARSGLVTQRKGSMYGGVNQQGAEQRLSVQVEEMINCIPTIDSGLRLRNPSIPLRLENIDGIESGITFPDTGEIFTHAYDRGTFNDRNSELLFLVTPNGGLEIVDLTLVEAEDPNGTAILVGKVYRKGEGITYANTDAEVYLTQMFKGKNSFAMTSIKDTTFVVNKTIAPKMIESSNDENDPVEVGNIVFEYDKVYGLNPSYATNNGNGNYTVNFPTNITDLRYSMVGGGGSAGGSGGGQGGSSLHASDDGNGSSGGGAASVLHGVFANSSSLTATVQVGRGGVERAGGRGGSYGGVNEGSSGDSGENGLAGGDSYVTYDFNQPTSKGGAGGLAGDGGCDGCSGSCGHGVSDGGGNELGSGGTAHRECKDYLQEPSSPNLSQHAVVFGTGGAGASGGTGGQNDFGFGGRGGGHGANGKVVIDWTAPVSGPDYYKRFGYVWVKKSDPQYGFKYGALVYVVDADGNPHPDGYPFDTGMGSNVTTGSDDAATDLATRIAALHADLNASSDGSLVQVSTYENSGWFIESVEAKDSFGDSASFGWGQRVEFMSDLPKNMGKYFKPIVRIGRPDEDGYWVRYTEGAWIEYRDPALYTTINKLTMPHVIKRVYNEVDQRWEFIVEQYEWDTRKVGDEDTNGLPPFLNVGTEETFLKDVFFYRNRLGLVTENSVSMSEIGEYGNFFRTTVGALLDSDRITTIVESTNAVNIEYALALQDSVVLFADKAQFRFQGGAVLSPTNFSIQQELAYDMNIDVRPFFMNNAIYFAARRGVYSAIYEMVLSDGSRSSTATDITAHCQYYVDREIEHMSGSPVNGMLFITSKERHKLLDPENPDVLSVANTVYVYKMYDEGDQRIQSAWSKWTFNGDLISGVAISENFYALVQRFHALSSYDWLMGDGLWDMAGVWKMGMPWIMTPATVTTGLKQIERIRIQPKAWDGVFLDAGFSRIDGYVNFGEWVYGREGDRDPRGKLQMRTVQVSAEEGSALRLWVEDKQRGKTREIPAKYALQPRKPMVYGEAKNIRVGIKSEFGKGFRVNMVSLEGTISSRANTRS